MAGLRGFLAEHKYVEAPVTLDVAFRRDYGVRGDRYRILLTYGFTYRDVEESDIQGAPTFDIAILPRRNRG
jgi:hypothetical protein